MIELIAFDADDTLWHNERLFYATESQFTEMLAAYHSADWVRQRLLATEVKNLGHFGYGIKGFILSMIETAIELTEERIGGVEIQRIINWGHEMLRAPVDLLDGVRETIEMLAPDYKLMLLTKGDLFDQESKLARSGLGDHFDAVEVVSEKDAKTYAAIMRRHGITPSHFLMVGNSVKSDILPVLEAGGAAVHIPYEMTWAHEHVESPQGEFTRLERITELPAWLRR
ncbi:MAG TPA: HAD family hydrolase [Thermoanaerobaculia bacterium]|jgi:putative hydrolase of the HAD superfamily